MRVSPMSMPTGAQVRSTGSASGRSIWKQTNHFAPDRLITAAPSLASAGSGRCHFTLIAAGMPTIAMRLLWRTLRPSPTRNAALSNQLLARNRGKPALALVLRRGEHLVEPTQYLLFGGIAIPGKPVIGEPHRLQFVRLIEVTKALALPLIRLKALLQAGVVELAERAKHAVQRHRLRSARIEAFNGPSALRYSL